MNGKPETSRTQGKRTRKHQWVGPRGPIRYVHCSVCLIIRSLSPSNGDGPCKGPAKVTLR